MFTAVVLICMSADPNFCSQVTMIRDINGSKVAVQYQEQAECLNDAKTLAGMIAQNFDGKVDVSFQCTSWSKGS